MEKSRFIALARKFNAVLFEENGLLSGALPLVVAGHTVGLVRAELLPLVRAASMFHVTEGAVTLDPALETPEARSAAMAELLQRWRTQENLVALRGWRNECYDVRASFSSAPLLKMERSATCVFGIRQYGVDLNGYTHHPERGFCVWIQRRSLEKPTWPGKLDNMVSGGLTSGLGLLEAVQKEAWEEAGIPEHLLPGIRSAGAVSFVYGKGSATFANHAFCFDIQLAPDFQPRNQDGEAEEFMLVTPKELMELVCSPEFKTTSAPVTLDFLIRHGFITPNNEPRFLEICELLHVPLASAYSTGRLISGLQAIHG
ncbi:nudix hydrolase 24, chloroplastic-like isoform X3 [Amphibalanus amphitrite]|uniref:nudix hydrolase 24, chloroplastic-like isoform X3 n=1 Tax=Amphibalanus amphitrite TaxID=1232801 RepID=UPI001C8FD73C|nr:nudix hydrolase 24, chloroplastic-like isoform X3 [Amphibalanus amphitrite]XP_043217722.1 nudix hydrolase 24, chloroplastic-like isoform X3 [Amphibalanus amphitrite]